MPRLAGFALLLVALSGGPVPAEQPSPPLPQPVYPPGVVDVTPEAWPGRVETACQPCHAEPGPSFLVSAEYLLVRARRRDLDYAVIDPNDDLAPQGNLTSLDWPTRSGLRTQFLWRPGGGANDIGLTYTYVYAKDSDAVAAPAGGLLYATLTRPGTADEANTAVAFSSLNYNVFDVDVGHRFGSDEGFAGRVFGGSRLAIIHQVLEATYDGRDSNQAFAQQRVNMDGGGLTAGGEARVCIAGGLSAFGRGRGSLVVGDYRVGFNQSDFAGNVILADANDKFMKVVPVLDLHAGLSWRFRGLRASLGYEISHWFSQVEGITFLDDFSEGKRGRRVADLSLEAITFGLSFDF